MYLKRLELQGFKSFPEKINLKFEKGITCVVGPNGSGKSNISDAVRWVLGEQSAKSLRGSKMEDIIFAGTENRKPLSFAQVSIIIDNEDFKIPLEFTEITVTRRVYRSGESEFLINDSPCRLKDIHELFMDTGIGREGYSIIGQGRIDKILNTRGEDRRFLFEEAAGIVKYRSRREEALIKLERQRQNLVRIQDIIDELESKLEPLKIQSIRAKEYLELTEQLKIIKINIFIIEADKTENILNKLKENIENNNFQLEDENRKKISIENKIVSLKEVLSKTEENYSEIQNKLIELRSFLEQKENDIKLIEEKNNYIDKEIIRIISEKEKLQNLIKNYKIQINALNSTIEDLKQELDKNNEILKKNQKEFDDLNLRMKEREIKIEKYNTDIFEGYKKTSDIKSYINKIKNFYESLEVRKEELIDEMAINLSKISEKQNQFEEVKEKLNNSKNNFEFFGQEIDNLTDLREKTIVLFEEKTKKHIEITSKLKDFESKYHIIKELKDDYEGYYTSTKAVLKQKKVNENFEGIHGAVGELIEVPYEYETAIEIALGSYVQNIVTKNENDAKKAIDYLKTTKQGRATFLPLTVIKPKHLNKYNEIKKENGVLGIAKDLISYNEIYNAIVSNILGCTVICDTLNNAVTLSKKYNNTFKIVTLDGDLINAGGSMTGGSIYKKATGIFGRERELKKLNENIIIFSEKQKMISEEVKKLNQDLEKIKINIKQKKIIYYEKEKEINEYTHTYNIINETLSLLYEKEKDYQLEDSQLMEQIVERNKEIRKLEKELIDVENEIQNIKDELLNFQSDIFADKESQDSRIKELTDIQIKISAITENIKSREEDLKRLNDETENCNNTIINLINEEQLNEQEKINNESKIKELKNNIDEANIKQKEDSNQLNGLLKQKIDISLEIDINEKEEKEQLDVIFRLEKEKTKLELKKEQSEEERRRIFDSIWEEYSITYQRALTYEKLEEKFLYKNENLVKEKIKNLGIININAIDEYEEVKERYEFLNFQKNDIILAEEQIKNLIKELTDLMSERFKEQFKLISENFNNVFKEMFQGGKAYLKLTDEENILESGIEIIAKPPGKNLQNMNLLSGGERALTAIALLFAILKMKPSPFCILDEIEAALDDANVKRFSDYIQNFSKETQFIVITHRKGTMEAADILYGVTMQEQGVSKLVSVELKNYEAV